MQDWKKSQEQRKTVFRKLREDAGLTREELVARMKNKISLTTVVRWENNGKEPSMTREEWALFCAAVGVPFSKLPTTLSEPAK